jgi:hypothetical protein
MTQLPSFLPALFDAFNNQSPDVRKVLCLFFDTSNMPVHCNGPILLRMGCGLA